MRLSTLFPNFGLEDLKNVVTILAIVLGGIGAYYKFFKGRLHVSRLELQVSGSAVCENGVSYLLVAACVKNIGLSKVDIVHAESGLRVTTHRPMANLEATQLVGWESPSVFNVFEDDLWIEPGETVEEEYLVEIPGCEETNLAFRLQLRIVSKNAYWQVNGIAMWDNTTKSKQSDAIDREGGLMR